jgi:hypothetical protein
MGVFNALQIAQAVGPGCPSAGSTAWVGGTSSIGDAAGTWTASLSTVDTYGVKFTFGSSATANESVTLCFQITDVDGNDPQGMITYTLVDSLQAASPVSPILVPPFTSYWIYAPTLTASDVITPIDPGLTLVLSSGTATSLGGSIGPASATNPPPTTTVPAGTACTAPASTTSIGVNGCFLYAPAPSPFLSCDVNGNDLATGGASCTNYDTFAYFLKPSVGTTTSNVATVSLNVQALTSFYRKVNTANSFSVAGTASDIYTIMGNSGSCTSCHGGSNAVAAAQWTFDSTSQLNTFQSFTNQGAKANGNFDWTQYDVSGNFVGHSSSAALYDNVCDSSSTHYNSEYNLNGVTPGCAVLLQWILEGAHDD